MFGHLKGDFFYSKSSQASLGKNCVGLEPCTSGDDVSLVEAYGKKYYEQEEKNSTKNETGRFAQRPSPLPPINNGIEASLSSYVWS